MRRLLPGILLLILAMGVAGCDDNTNNTPADPDDADYAHDPDNDGNVHRLIAKETGRSRSPLPQPQPGRSS
jgi:hypothetical protein